MAKLNPNPPTLTPQRIKRFWQCIDSTPGQGPQGECWQWKLQTNNKGYGMFYSSSPVRNVSAHRLAYFLSNQDWPLLNVLHRCDNPPCCNPAHLFLGTNQDNSTDMKDKGRHGAKLHIDRWERGAARHNAKLTEGDVRAIRTSTDTTRAIARLFHTHQANVIRIRQRKAWKHVI